MKAFLDRIFKNIPSLKVNIFFKNINFRNTIKTTINYNGSLFVADDLTFF